MACGRPTDSRCRKGVCGWQPAPSIEMDGVDEAGNPIRHLIIHLRETDGACVVPLVPLAASGMSRNLWSSLLSSQQPSVECC